MRISAIQNYNQRFRTFKGKNNPEDYLSRITVSNNDGITDLRKINTSLRNEIVSILHEKREISEQNERKLLRLEKSPLEATQESIKEYSNRLKASTEVAIVGTTSTLAPNIIKIIASDFRHGTSYLLNDYNGNPFENSVQMPKVKLDSYENLDEESIIKAVNFLFEEFCNNDTSLIITYLKRLVAISKEYFTQNEQDFKGVQNIRSKIQKWSEYIPILGLASRIERVSAQQEATKQVYKDYQEFNNVIIEQGISPVIDSYIIKLNKIKEFIQLVAPFLSNRGNSFTQYTVDAQLDQVATQILKSYQYTLESITLNGENIANTYNRIIEKGDKAVKYKLLRSIITLGI